MPTLLSSDPTQYWTMHNEIWVVCFILAQISKQSPIFRVGSKLQSDFGPAGVFYVVRYRRGYSLNFSCASWRVNFQNNPLTKLFNWSVPFMSLDLFSKLEHKQKEKWDHTPRTRIPPFFSWSCEIQHRILLVRNTDQLLVECHMICYYSQKLLHELGENARINTNMNRT